MKLIKVELPSNKKFGYFCTFIFALVAFYFYIQNKEIWVYFFAISSGLFFIATLLKASVLQPLNKIWMSFGVLLGMIVSPLVLGAIFFGIFTPLAFLMRLTGRDELRLKFNNQESHWIKREETVKAYSFKNQF